MFVSTIERRKNHVALYQAYHLLCAQGHRDDLPTLVFVGMPGWGVEDLLSDIRLDPLTQGKIKLLDHVSDADLQLLYNSAEFCLFPSFYEGWGLPVAEALSHGKLVLSSDQGSLPEVGGDLVTYIDPWSARDWANKILQFSLDQDLRREHEARVRDEYTPRSWEQGVKVICEAVKELDKS